MYFVRSVLQKIPESVKMPDREGALPFHHAVRFRVASAYLVRILLQEYSSALRITDGEGRLPMHWAAFGGAENEILDLMHDRYPQSYPQSLNIADDEGCSPLHLACRSDVPQSVETVAWLIDKNPLAVQSIDKLGYLPLHWAALNHKNCSIPIMKLLADKFPRALQTPNESGNLPVHVVHDKWKIPSSVDAVKFLLEQCPGSAAVKNRWGELPIHSAGAYKSVSVPMMDLLIKHNPRSLAVFDNKGFLPFHYCCTYAEDRTVITSLVTRFKGAALPPTKHGTPALFVACENDAKVDVIMCLVQHSLELFSGDQVTSIQNGNGFEGQVWAPRLRPRRGKKKKRGRYRKMKLVAER